MCLWLLVVLQTVLIQRRGRKEVLDLTPGNVLESEDHNYSFTHRLVSGCCCCCRLFGFSDVADRGRLTSPQAVCWKRTIITHYRLDLIPGNALESDNNDVV